MEGIEGSSQMLLVASVWLQTLIYGYALHSFNSECELLIFLKCHLSKTILKEPKDSSNKIKKNPKKTVFSEIRRNI